MNKSCIVCEIPLRKNNKSLHCVRHYKLSEKSKLSVKRWSDANQDRQREAQKRYCKSEKGKKTRAAYGRKFSLAKNFNISESEYLRLLETQNGKCAICSKDSKDIKKRLCVDHDHSSGKVRGLLCKSCNIGLGEFKDSIEFLSKAISYLRGE